MGHGVAMCGLARPEHALGHTRLKYSMPLACWQQALHCELSWPTRYLSGKEIGTRTTLRATVTKRVGSPELGECPDDGGECGGQGTLSRSSPACVVGSHEGAATSKGRREEAGVVAHRGRRSGGGVTMV
jgi:hypothetical protein